MSQVISPLWIGRIIIVGIIAVTVKALWLIALFFLPQSGVERVTAPDSGFYDSYKVARALGLEAKKAPVKKKAPLYKLDNVTLKALFDSEDAPFIMIEDERKLIMVALHENFKGYKLIDVQDDRAIFEKDDRRYELLFKDAKPVKGSITEAEPEVIQNDTEVFIKRKEIKYYAKNFDQIWKSIKIKEVIEKKRLKGFRVTWVRRKSIFEQLGLKKGDLIIGVNGKKLKSISQVFRIYNNIDKLDSLKLLIIRDNQEKELEYEVF